MTSTDPFEVADRVAWPVGSGRGRTWEWLATVPEPTAAELAEIETEAAEALAVARRWDVDALLDDLTRPLSPTAVRAERRWARRQLAALSISLPSTSTSTRPRSRSRSGERTVL